MFKLKYTLKEHLNGASERYYTSGLVKLLFAEVGTVCPKCNETLDWHVSKNFDEKLNLCNIDVDSSDNQIAHIYGRRLFKKNNLSLDKPYHIKDSDRLDMYENLIILCKNCHKKYDCQPTYEKYVEMLKIKKKINEKINIESYMISVFHEFSNEFIKVHSNIESRDYKDGNSEEINDYQKVYLKEKLLQNNISRTQGDEIINTNIDYFQLIKTLIENEDEGDKLINAFNIAYKKLKKDTDNKDEILQKLKKSFYNQEFYLSKMFEKVLSYMIMICEVLDVPE